MKFLIGDIGNTSTKICVLNSKFKIFRSYNFETNKMYSGNFLKMITRRKIYKDLSPIFLFSSVVPKVFRNIEKKLKLTKYKVLELKNLNLNKIIKINVKNKKQLGSDRIANAIGVKKFKNCLVLDFGTATTFDVIKNGVYEGGVIAPGVKISIKNLSKSTALLPSINLSSNQKNYGKNTIEAINAGFIWGYEGLINNIINKIISKNKIKYKIILTGGYANFFKKMIKKNVVVDQDITVKGISNVYKELL
jgi:type III pantothenate kinase|tara:strand:+ start:944 stop:1690 length:747 start_codon:yes stop_codon:yes gene_type:complete